MGSTSAQMALEPKAKILRFWGFYKLEKINLNFNRNFLKDEKRYSTFPVDFLKAETILFPKNLVSFHRMSPNVRQKSSWKNNV